MIRTGGFGPDPKPEKQEKKSTKWIKPRSQKKERLERKYNKRRIVWIEDKNCAVYHDRKAAQIHHMMGRVGYADDWARERDLPLLLDERYWLPVCFDGHRQIEHNPDWAKLNGYSIERTNVRKV
jgi:hypothetical protein